MSLSHQFRSLLLRAVSARKTSTIRRTARPFNRAIERLEDRSVPATLTWVGDVDGNWGTNNAGNTNWSGNVLPAAGDSLVFNNTNVGFSTTTNNIAGLALASIQITDVASNGKSYTLNGVQVDLGATGLHFTQPTTGTGGGPAVGLPLRLTAAAAINNTSAQRADLSGAIDTNGFTATFTCDSTREIEVGGAISGTGGITKNGDGILTLSSANTYDGATIINGGSLTVTVDHALGNTTGGTTVNVGSTLGLQGVNYTTLESLELNGSGGVFNGALESLGLDQFAGSITLGSNASIATDGNGSLTLNGTVDSAGVRHQLTLSALSGSTHPITFQNTVGAGVGLSGIIQSNDVSQVTFEQDVTLGSGTSTLNSNVTLDSLTFSSSGPVTFGNTATDTLTISGGAVTLSQGVGQTTTINAATTLTSNLTISGSGNFSVPGAVGGAGSLTKGGSGTATLAGTNNYAGTTQVNAGLLLVNGTNSGIGAVNVNNSAVLGGTGSISGAVNINNTARLAPGGSPGSLASGSVTYSAGTFFDIELNGTTPGTQHDQLVAVGSVALNGATLNPTIGYIPTFGDAFTIVNNDGNADHIGGTFAGLPEGKVFTSGANSLQITYRGGDGNDLTLRVIDPANPSLNGTPGADVFSVRRNAANVEILLNGTTILATPLAGLTSLTLNGLGNTDTFEVDYLTGGAFSLPIAVNGGGGADGLSVIGGAFGTIAYDYTNATDGFIHNYQNPNSTNLLSTIAYIGLAPITNSGTATDIVFNLPGTTDATISLGDIGGGKARLASTVPTFEQTDFTYPLAGGSITVNLGANNQTVTVNPLALNANTALTINGQGGTNDIVTLAGTGDLALTGTLAVTAETIDQTNAVTVGNTATLNAGAGGITLTNPNNDFTSITASATGTGTISVTDKTGGLIVTNATTANGDIAFTTTSGGLTLTATSTGGTSGDVTANVTGGNILVGNVTAGNTVSLTTNGEIEEAGSDVGADITAQNTRFTATTGIGAAGTIELAASKLAATTGTGGVFLTNSGQLLITTIGAVSGVTVTGASGNITLAAASPLAVNAIVSSPGAINLTAGDSAAGGDNLSIAANVTSTGGGTITLVAGDNITQSAGTISSSGVVRFTADNEGAGGVDGVRGGISQSGGNLTAASAVFRSGNAVGFASTTNDIDTFAAIVTVNGQGFEYCDADSLDIASVDGINDITTTNGNATVGIETGNLSINQNIAAGSGAVRLQTNGAAGAVSGTGVITAAALGVRAGSGGVTLVNTANDVNSFAAATTGSVSFQDADGFSVGTVLAQGCFTPDVNGISGATDVELCVSTGNLTIASPIAASATVRLHAENGSVNESSSSGTITANELGVRGDNGVVTLGSNNDVNTLAVFATGNVTVVNNNGVTIDAVTAGTCFTGATGVTTSDGNISITNNTSGDMTVNQVVTAGTLGTGIPNSIILDANSPLADLNVNVAVTSDRGDISLSADDDATFAAAGDLSSNNGNVRVTGDADSSGAGAVMMDQDTTMNAGTGTIVASAGGDVTLGDMTTNNATPSAVSVTSTAGAILDAGTDADAEITANAANSVVTLSAGSGIGSANAIETQVAALQATNSTNGNIQIAEADAITLLSVVQSTASDANDITVSAATSEITVVSINNTGNTVGDVNLTAMAGSILDDNSDTTRITGDVLVLRATNTIGALPGGSATEDLDTDAEFVDAQTSAAGANNGIWISDLGSVTYTQTITADGEVDLAAATGLIARTITAGGTGRDVRLQTTTSGDVALGTIAGDSVTAAGDKVLIQAVGSVLDNNGPGVNVTASDLAATAGLGIGNAGNFVETDINNLAANSGVGGAYFSDISALTVTTVTAFGVSPVVGVTAVGSGAIGLAANGAIAVNERVTSGSGPIGATANGTIAEAGAGRFGTLGQLTTSAIGGQLLDGANTIGGFDATNTGGGPVNLTNTSTNLNITRISQTGAGQVRVANTGALQVTSNGVTADGGSVSLSASGGSATLNAGVSTLAAGAINLTTTGAGNGIAVNAATTTGTGTITAVAGGAIAQTGGRFAGGALIATSTGGQDLDGANAVTSFAAGNAGGNVLLINTAINLTINGVGQSAGGNTNVTNVGAVTVAGGVNGDGVGLTANGGGMLVGAGVTANTGAVGLSTTGAGNPIAVNAVVAAVTSATASSGGAITQSGGLFQAPSLNATSAGGQALGGANAVSTFTAANTGTGALSLNNTIALTLAGVSQQANGAPLSVTNGSSVNVTGVVGAANGPIAINCNGDFTTLATDTALLDAGAGTILVVPRTAAGARVELASEVQGSDVQIGQPALDTSANTGPNTLVIRPSHNAVIRVFGNNPSVATPETPGDSIFPLVANAGIVSIQLVVEAQTGQSISGRYDVLHSNGVRNSMRFAEIESFAELGFRAAVVQTGATTYSVRATASQGDQPVNASIDGQGLQTNPFVVSPRVVSSNTRFSPPSVAFGDVNGDGNADMILSNGANDAPLVTIVDGISLARGQVRLDRLTPETGLITQFYAYNQSFRGGISVSAADMNNDGRAEIITGAGNSGGAHVRMFSLRPDYASLPLGERINFSPSVPFASIGGVVLGSMASFLPFGPAFRGGVNVATGDIDADGRSDLILGAGIGGAPRVMVFSGADGKMIQNFFAYGEGLRGGVLVASGDFDGGGRADILTGPGYGGAPHIEVFGFTTGQPELLASFFAFDFVTNARGIDGLQVIDPNASTGVGSVAFGIPDGTGRQEILVSTAQGPRLQLRRYNLSSSSVQTDPNLYGLLTVGSVQTPLAYPILDPITGRVLSEQEFSDGGMVGGIAT